MLPPITGPADTPRLAWLVPAGLLLCLGGISLGQANESLFQALNALGPLSPTLWSMVTLLGDSLIVFALMLPVVVVRPDLAWALLLTALIATPLVHIPKDLLDVMRPAAVLAADEINVIGHTLRHGSFPSGHSATAFATAAVLSLGLRLKTTAILAVVVVAGMIALSRSVVGAHWPQDLAAGAAIGWLSGILGLWLAAKWPWGAGRRGQWLMAALFTVCALALLPHDSGYPLAEPLQWTLAFVAILSAQWLVLKHLRRPNRGA